MAQELIDKIRAAAQAKGIDPETALRIARAESGLKVNATPGTSSAGGLFQVVDKTWKEFGGKPGKKYDPDENIRVGTDIIAKNTQTLKSFLNRDPRPAEVYAAHYFGPSGAKNFLSAEPGTPMESIFSKEVIKANPNLKGKTTAQVMASLEKKMGGKPVQQAKASPSAEQVAPAPARAAGEPSARTVSAAPAAATVSRETISSLGPGYQAALALSFLADTDEKEDRDIDREPGIAEKWLAESTQASRPAALAEFFDISIKSPFAALEPKQPQMLADGGEVEEPGVLSVPTYSKTVSYEMYPGQEGQFDQRDAARHMLASGTLARKYGPTAAEMLGKLHEIGTSPMRFIGSKLGISEMPVDYEQDLHNNRIGIELGKRSKSQKDLEDLVQQMAEQAKGQRVEGKPWTGRPVKRADGSPEEGERLTPQQIERIAAQEAMEREAASRPATVNPNIQRQGEAARRLAAMRDVNTLPDPRTYAAVSGFLGQAPDELGFSVMHPDREGIKKAGEIGFGVGTALQVAPVMGALRAAGIGPSSAGRPASAASQLGAVRTRGTPFVMAYGDEMVDGRLPLMDQAEKYVRSLATTNDSRLNEWFSNKITPYLRRDFASPEDQFVQAADKNMLLHLAAKPTKRDPAESASQYDRRMNLQGTRKMEGFPEEGVATTPYGKRVEAQIDESAWPAWLEDITSPGLVPPSMRGMAETNPSARVTELGNNIEKKLKFEDLRNGMAEMRQLGPEFSAYGQAPVKVPKEYMLTDEALVGLTPAQASNRVATFRNWRDDNRQRMATKYAKEDPSLDRVELPGGVTAVQLPDLQSSPNVKQLALDVGCDGNWCTQREASALDYGSGNNRLHILVDKKARPLAQITFSKLPPTKKQLEADPSAGDRFSITEMLGKDNSADFSQSPALPALQQYIKSLDRQHGLAFVANLDKINMKELGTADLLKGAKELSDRRQRYQPGISPEEYMAATQRDIIDFETALYELNGGSKYLAKDQDMNSLVQQTLDRLAPQKRATGGMIERQSTDNRRYL